MAEHWMTIKEFCERNKCTRGYVYTEHRAGRLPFVKMGRATRIKFEDEKAWRDSLPVIGGQ